MKMVDLIYKNNNAKCGNHKLEINKGVKNLIYYSTCICKVNPYLKMFAIDNSFGSTSTSKACTLYKNELLENGYTQLDSIHDERLN